MRVDSYIEWCYIFVKYLKEYLVMKKFVSILLVVLVCSIAFSSIAADYSFLDGMSLEELIALQSELESRITVAKNAAGASDPTNTGIWKIKYYVDEFNNPTTEGYITTKEYVKGTFNNSATTNSLLYVIWLIDKDDVAIKLAEYGSNVVKSSYDTTYYSIVMLDPDGKKVSMTGTMYKGGDRIYIDTSYESTVLEALKRNSSVTFKITEKGKYASSDYLFKMEDTSFFENAYNMLK